MPYRIVRAFLEDLPDDRPIVTICSSGSRASIAASVIASAGMKVRPVLGGGIPEWAERGGNDGAVPPLWQLSSARSSRRTRRSRSRPCRRCGRTTRTRPAFVERVDERAARRGLPTRRRVRGRAARARGRRLPRRPHARLGPLPLRRRPVDAARGPPARLRTTATRVARRRGPAPRLRAAPPRLGRRGRHASTRTGSTSTPGSPITSHHFAKRLDSG